MLKLFKIEREYIHLRQDHNYPGFERGFIISGKVFQVFLFKEKWKDVARKSRGWRKITRDTYLRKRMKKILEAKLMNVQSFLKKKKKRMKSLEEGESTEEFLEVKYTAINSRKRMKETKRKSLEKYRKSLTMPFV